MNAPSITCKNRKGQGRLGSLSLRASLLSWACGFELLLATAAFGQSYSIDWFTISGGGWLSTNDQFKLTCTIAQPDASVAMRGDNYSLSGGFWSLFAVVQTLGTPPLSLSLSGGDVVLLWPVSSAGFILQQNSQLATTNWTDVSLAALTNGANVQVVVPISSGNRFFRLRGP